MGMFDAMNIAASGMTVQRLRMDIVSQNIANVNTTRDANGNVYRRQMVKVEEKDGTPFADVLMMTAGKNGCGVKATGIVQDTETELKATYDPSNPDADEDGYVWYPNVNTVTEMTDLIDASRAYEANVTTFNAAKNMALKGLEVGK